MFPLVVGLYRRNTQSYNFVGLNMEDLEDLLLVGTQIKLGPNYCKEMGNGRGGDIITLIEGYFDYDNGLYTEIQTAPSVWNENAKEFDSIYHFWQ